MNYEFPLVFFTVLSQLAVGMTIYLCWNLYARPDALDRDVQKKSWIWITVAAACGLLLSLLHLGHPFAAWKALNNLGVSWLSWEGLGFACFCGLAFINIFYPTRFLALLTALIGAFGLVAQGMTYAPPAIPALNNSLPMAFFWLSALAMGGCALAILVRGREEIAARYAIIALLVLLLAGPAIWISGTATMRESALLWFGSAWFWVGLILVALALLGTWFQEKISLKWQLVALVCGIICTRMVIFADTIHTAANLGWPYN